jgi:beta-lactamase superfamily II metal-dependent hydrolase
MRNKAKEIIIPEKNVLRIIFLYVGQGDSTLLVVPSGEEHKFALVDSNQDDSLGGINIVKLLKDLFKDEDRKLDVYINTHPHKDHLGGIKDIYNEVGINQLWHSGHKPGGEHKEVYKGLKYVIDNIGEENVFCLKGSREENKLDDKEVKLGDINYNVLAPAEYVSDDIEDEKPEDRYKRIHEQCAIVRFKYGKKEKQILITGDADYEAWTKHITDYHKDRLPSFVLGAVHHGSNSFFWKGEIDEEDPYKKHLDVINPKYIIVSAPKSKESKHNHPHKEAMGLYKEKVGSDNLHHLGKNRECIIVDIKEDGNIELYPDDSLVEAYGIDKSDENGNEDKKIYPGVVTKIDRKPMG